MNSARRCSRQQLLALQVFWWPFFRIAAVLTVAPFIGDMAVPAGAPAAGAGRQRGAAGAPAGDADIDALSPAWRAGHRRAGPDRRRDRAGAALSSRCSVMRRLPDVHADGLVHGADERPGQRRVVLVDPLSAVCYPARVLVFFAIDGHLVLLASSPELQGLAGGQRATVDCCLRRSVQALAWVFSAAMLLALPIVFSPCSWCSSASAS